MAKKKILRPSDQSENGQCKKTIFGSKVHCVDCNSIQKLSDPYTIVWLDAYYHFKKTGLFMAIESNQCPKCKNL